MPENAVVHYLVGTPAVDRVQIRFRRFQLLRYLAGSPSTDLVRWIVAAGMPTGGSAGEQTIEDLDGNPRRIVEHRVPDFRLLAAYGRSLQRWSHRGLVEAVRADDAAGRERMLWYTLPQQSRLIDLGGWAAVHYDCSDLWTATERAGGLLARTRNVTIRASEEKIVAGASILSASSAGIRARLRSRHGRDAVLVENGVDFALFAGAAARPDSGAEDSVRLGFVGGMKPHKIDFELLHAVAVRRPEWRVVLAGPASKGVRGCRAFSQLVALDNVEWSGVIEPAAVPDLLRRLRVGLLPYHENEYNEGVTPLKLFEYLAADLPVVATGLPSIARYEEPEVLRMVRGADAFIDAIEAALAGDRACERRTAIAAGASWKERFRRLPIEAGEIRV